MGQARIIGLGGAGPAAAFALLLALLYFAPAQATGCFAQSGAHTAALVELYTSQECRTCPWAERWLAGLGARGYVPGRVLPIALHIDYRAYLGRKDGLRQRKLTPRQRMALTYTPQVLLQGAHFQGWSTPAFEEAVLRINARPAAARIKLTMAALDARGVTAHAVVDVHDEGQRADAALYMAAYETRLHDYVVFEWQGPFPVSTGRLQERLLPLVPGAKPESSGVAGFVQNRRTAQVLQALALAACQ